MRALEVTKSIHYSDILSVMRQFLIKGLIGSLVVVASIAMVTSFSGSRDTASIGDIGKAVDSYFKKNSIPKNIVKGDAFTQAFKQAKFLKKTSFIIPGSTDKVKLAWNGNKLSKITYLNGGPKNAGYSKVFLAGGGYSEVLDSNGDGNPEQTVQCDGSGNCETTFDTDSDGVVNRTLSRVRLKDGRSKETLSFPGTKFNSVSYFTKDIHMNSGSRSSEGEICEEGRDCLAKRVLGLEDEDLWDQYNGDGEKVCLNMNSMFHDRVNNTSLPSCDDEDYLEERKRNNYYYRQTPDVMVSTKCRTSSPMRSSGDSMHAILAFGAEDLNQFRRCMVNIRNDLTGIERDLFNKDMIEPLRSRSEKLLKVECQELPIEMGGLYSESTDRVVINSRERSHLPEDDQWTETSLKRLFVHEYVHSLGFKHGLHTEKPIACVNYCGIGGNEGFIDENKDAAKKVCQAPKSMAPEHVLKKDKDGKDYFDYFFTGVGGARINAPERSIVTFLIQYGEQISYDERKYLIERLASRVDKYHSMDGVNFQESIAEYGRSRRETGNTRVDFYLQFLQENIDIKYIERNSAKMYAKYNASRPEDERDTLSSNNPMMIVGDMIVGIRFASFKEGSHGSGLTDHSSHNHD
ncbi:MAG: hypothetical protein AB8E15_02525 [Bdellovibrionales bacterium]